MKKVSPFCGMMPILPTAITPSGDIDEVSMRRLVQYALKCGVAAIGHFGFASEFHKLSDDQRCRLIEVLLEEINGAVPFFCGVTAQADHISVKYAKEAAAMGVDIIMAATPYVSVPDRAGLVDYYRKINAATSLPIIVQDTPLSAALLDTDTLMRMFNEMENIHYIKAEGNDFLQKTVKIMAASDQCFPVIGGASGQHMLHMCRCGVTAFMTGTEALDIHGGVLKAALAGDMDRAARIYFEKLLPYRVFYDSFGNELLKDMLFRRGVIDCPDQISPAGVSSMDASLRKEFDWVLDRIGFWNQKWPDIQVL